MIILHKKTYNPKIDFLICKNLLCELPPIKDEHKFIRCFNEEEEMTECFEQKAVEIKKYFMKHDLSQFTNQDIENLYYIIVNKRIVLGDMAFKKISSADDIISVVSDIRQMDVSSENTLFKLILLKMCGVKQSVPLIVYDRLCWKIFVSALESNCSQVNELWDRLIKKTLKYSYKHSVDQNIEAVNQVKKYCNEYIDLSGAISLYLCGSLATGTGNEYSDVDIVSVFKDDTDVRGARKIMQAYWKERIPIPIDVLVFTESELKEKMQPAMKRTLKKIGGE